MNQIIFHSVSARPALYTNTSSVGRSLTPGPLAPRAPDVSCATLRPRLRRGDFPPPLRDDAPLPGPAKAIEGRLPNRFLRAVLTRALSGANMSTSVQRCATTRMAPGSLSAHITC